MVFNIPPGLRLFIWGGPLPLPTSSRLTVRNEKMKALSGLISETGRSDTTRTII